MRRRTTTDDMSPVEYPAFKRYTDWHFFNGQLILKAVPEIDTVQIRMLTADSLILEFPDHTQEYYRKE